MRLPVLLLAAMCCSFAWPSLVQLNVSRIASWERRLACAAISKIHTTNMTQRIEEGLMREALCERMHVAKARLQERRVVGEESEPLWVTINNIAILSVVQRYFDIGAQAGDAAVALQSRGYDAILAAARAHLHLLNFERSASLYLRSTGLLRSSPSGLAIRAMENKLLQFTAWGRVLGTEVNLL